MPVSCGTTPDHVQGTIFEHLEYTRHSNRFNSFYTEAYAKVSECMQDLGYPPDSYLIATEADLSEYISGVFFLNREAIESGVGYGLAEYFLKSEKTFTDSRDLHFQPESLAHAEQHGADYRSCKAKQPGLEEVNSLTVEIAMGALDLPKVVFGDSRLVETNSAWSQCMGLHGHSYRSPLAAYKELEGLMGSQTVHGDHGHGQPGEQFDMDISLNAYRLFLLEVQRQEVAIAADDLGCREAIGADYSTAVTEIEREQAAKYQSQMERLLEIVEAG